MDKIEILKKAGKGGWLIVKGLSIGVAYVSKSGYKGTKKGIALINSRVAQGAYICDHCQRQIERQQMKLREAQQKARAEKKPVPTSATPLDHSGCGGSRTMEVSTIKNADGGQLRINFNCVCNDQGHRLLLKN